MYKYPNANTIERVEEIIQELKNFQEQNINGMVYIKLYITYLLIIIN